MRQAKVLYKNIEAGILTQHNNASFTFRYNEAWLNDSSKPGISLNFPKQKKPYCSKYLFSYFYNMLPEGSNRQVVCQKNRIDEKDDFGLLITVANVDTIGAVRINKIE